MEGSISIQSLRVQITAGKATTREQSVTHHQAMYVRKDALQVASLLLFCFCFELISIRRPAEKRQTRNDSIANIRYLSMLFFTAPVHESPCWHSPRAAEAAHTRDDTAIAWRAQIRRFHQREPALVFDGYSIRAKNIGLLTFTSNQ